MKPTRTLVRFIRPMECLKVDRIPEGELWQYELKLDGYRCVAIKEDNDRASSRYNGCKCRLRKLHTGVLDEILGIPRLSAPELLSTSVVLKIRTDRR
jgi:hypothetical protein